MFKSQTDQINLIPDDAYLFFPRGKWALFLVFQSIIEEDTRTAAGVRCIFDGHTKFNESELKSIDQFRAYAKKHAYTLKSMYISLLAWV